MTKKRDAELRELAIDYVEGKVWTDRDCHESEVLTVFLPLALMVPTAADKRRMKRWGLIYGHIGRHRTAGAVNGKPIFFAFAVLTKPELVRFQAHVDRYVTERKRFVEGKGR